MKSLRFLLPMLGAAALCAVGCSEEEGTPGGDAGAGGQAEEPVGGSGGSGGSDGGGGACSEVGSGTVVIEVSGLPTGVAADVSITGPDELAVEEEGELSGVAAGGYTVTAARVFDADPIVRTVFDAAVTAPDFCLEDGGSHTVQVTYTAIPSSNKLWMPTAMDDDLAGFASSDIAETAMVDPLVSIDVAGSGSLAFDRDGNLWAVGPDVGGNHLVRIPAAELGESGTRVPDIEIVDTDITCFPFISNIAFDSAGNLWLSSPCEDGQLHRLDAADLTSSGEKTSSVVFSGVGNNMGIAFDNDGNLWAAAAQLLRFDEARLDTGGAEPADFALSVTPAQLNDSTVLGTEQLAFDQGGNLWGVSGSVIFQVGATDLTGTGEAEVKANVSFTIDVAALPSTPAFDEANGLWVDLALGQFGRFSVEQLGESHGPGAPVTPEILITSDAVSSTLPVAFFPAPAGLPLYHAIPE